ncbi:phosphopantetheine-binding protein [Sphingomonas gei]|uniref:phosphopantetheine-binding protein n=1 Tax=Sphingomonas gei TaxID=1395960 RepID=UPI003B82E177
MPAPDGDAFARQAYEAPQGEIEQALAAIWSELLGIERISRHDNFFELGGHSLAVVRMLSRAESQFHLNIPLSTIFEYPILSVISAIIAESITMFETSP